MTPVMSKCPLLHQSYQMDCYFRQSWVDTRLRFAGTGNFTTLPVSINILERMWKPDTHFFNGKKSYLHMVTTPNKLLRINADGRILYSMRFLTAITFIFSVGDPFILMKPQVPGHTKAY